MSKARIESGIFTVVGIVVVAVVVVVVVGVVVVSLGSLLRAGGLHSPYSQNLHFSTSARSSHSENEVDLSAIVLLQVNIVLIDTR